MNNKRNFNEWLSKFKCSISDYNYYVDFEKAYKHLDKIKIELNILNSLIGSKNIEKDFENIILKYSETLECIPILLAVRANEIYVKDEINEYLFNFNKMVYSISDYNKFMRESGLFELLEHHIINNLYDYVLGVEVGLDSNGRKNRGGHLMENLVESYIKKAGFIKDKTYFKEMYLNDIENKWNMDLSLMSGNDVSTKRFDFVIKTDNQVYVIETNFYGGSGGGSKLNETARSYKMLAEEAKSTNGITFIWITDGTAWKSARKNLEETFNVLETLYNINDLDNGILEKIN
jgi:type II restriction enzyme